MKTILAIALALAPLPLLAEEAVQEEWNAQKRVALLERIEYNREIIEEELLKTERLFEKVETRGLATPEMRDLWTQARELTRDALQ